MKMKYRCPALAGALMLVAPLALAPVLAQAPTTKPGATTWTSRTPWDDPDLQGIWWTDTPTPLQARPGAKAVLTAEEAAKVAAANRAAYDRAPREGSPGTYNGVWREFGEPLLGRVSLIVDPPDGRLPPMTPEGTKRSVKPLKGDAPDGPEDVDAPTRCITGGPMNWVGHYGFPRIVQTPGYVTISQLRMHETRIVPLDGRPHPPQNVRKWQGYSRGRWEGNTLVVDTTNFTYLPGDKSGDGFWGSQSALGIIRPTETLHLVERFARVDANTINYEITIDDPTMWTRPWTVAFPLRAASKDFGIEGAERGLSEYACHEGNYTLVAVLHGARVKENAAKSKK